MNRPQTMPTDDTTIGVFFGSRSPEHDVSIITAELVIKTLRKLGYKTVPVYISKQGDFYVGNVSTNPDDKTLSAVSYFDDDELDKKLSKLPQYSLDINAGDEEMVFRAEGFISSRTVTISLAFPTFHGPNGEDGAIQGLFELLDMPYVGCDVGSSALAMDKALTKQLYRQLDIDTTDFMYITEDEWSRFQDEVLTNAKHLNFPVFVKPARAGSSIGIAKVEEPEKLGFFIDTAFNFDSKVVVEEGVENVADLTVCVLGNDRPKPSKVQESRFESGFFSYEEKYLKEGGTQTGNAEKNIIIPADIPDEISEKAKRQAVRIFKEFDCSGIARVDFLFDRDSRKLYANEINPLPGTLYHHLWKASGKSVGELVNELVRLAKERHEADASLTYTFDSDILKRAGGPKMGDKLDQDESEE